MTGNQQFTVWKDNNDIDICKKIFDCDPFKKSPNNAPRYARSINNYLNEICAKNILEQLKQCKDHKNYENLMNEYKKIFS